MSRAQSRTAAPSKAAMPYTLPPDAREKLVQVAHLVGDIIELVMRGHDCCDASATLRQRPRRQGSRPAYVPPQPPSDIDRAKARRLLANKGLIEVAR